MRVANYQIFDNVISGPGPWYSSADFNALLGAADYGAIHAEATGVKGTSPTITIRTEHSPDNQNWVELAATPQVNGAALIENNVYVGLIGLSPACSRNVRCRITLGGTNPECRLKVYFTVRAYNAPQQAGQRRADAGQGARRNGSTLTRRAPA